MAREFITALLPLLVIVTALVPTSVSDTDALHIPERASCACPGDVLTYTCNIAGGGTTIWDGTAFDCRLNAILLRHSQFASASGTSGSCNDEAIVARSVGVNNLFCYISELNVTVSSSLHSKTIQCTHNSGVGEMIIDTSTIAVVITNDAVLEPPDNVHIADIQDEHAILEWRPAIGVPVCSSIDYSVISNCSSDCSIITSTTAKCSRPQQMPTMEPLTCAFSVQSVVCGNLTGRPSIPAIFVFHDQAPPNPPLTLVLEEIGPIWVFLSWERPFSSSATIISFYEILVQAVNNDAAATVNISTSDDRTHFNVSGLIPGTMYEISVVAVSERGAGMTLRSLPSVPIEFMTESLESVKVYVQALCSVVVWYNPDIFCEYMISGYDVRFYSSQQGSKNVTRSTGANQTFYIIQDEDGLVDKHDINVQVRVIHENLSEGEWSKGISLGCERPTTPPEAPSVYFELKGVTYMNNSAAFLLEVGEGENALLCKTNNENCCGTPPNRFGEFYYPNGVKVPIAKQQQGFYRNRGEKIIRLNRRDGAILPTGRYRCEIPDASGSMQNIFITLNA